MFELGSKFHGIGAAYVWARVAFTIRGSIWAEVEDSVHRVVRGRVANPVYDQLLDIVQGLRL